MVTSASCISSDFSVADFSSASARSCSARRRSSVSSGRADGGLRFGSGCCLDIVPPCARRQSSPSCPVLTSPTWVSAVAGTVLAVSAQMARRWAVYFVSIWAVGFGVASMVRADLGVSPNDVLNTGIADVAGISVGIASWCTAGIAMALAWLLGRPPLIPTVLGGAMVGLGINLGAAVLPSVDSMALRVVLLAIGLVAVWAAVTGVVASDVGAGPVELIMLALLDRGVGVRVARWAIELGLLLAGMTLGGAAGAGTVLFALLTGPVLARTLPPAAALLGTHITKVEQEAAATASQP